MMGTVMRAMRPRHNLRPRQVQGWPSINQHDLGSISRIFYFSLSPITTS
jgi:hypothetical protein